MITKEKLKVAIFDLDGVIVSTDQYHYESWAKIIDKNFGIILEEKDKDLVRGIPRPAALKILLEKYKVKKPNSEEFNDMLIEKNDFYIKLLDNIKIGSENEGARELLEYLKDNDVKVILASSSKNAKYILERLELLNLFDAIVDVDSIKNHKPSPDIFQKAFELSFAESKEDCIVIEDAQSGIDGAKEAGIYTIAYNDSDQILYNYDIEVNDHYEIIKLLG